MKLSVIFLASSSATSPKCFFNSGVGDTDDLLYGRSFSSESELLLSLDRILQTFLLREGEVSLESWYLPWVAICLLQLLLVEKLLLQPSTVQTKGFSPVWERMCCFKALFWFQRFPQPSNSHTKGFSPVWIRLWMRRWAGLRKDLPQPGYSQTCGLAPWWCPRKWSTKFLLDVNSRPHSGAGHLNGLSAAALSKASSSSRVNEAEARISNDIVTRLVVQILIVQLKSCVVGCWYSGYKP